MIAVLCVMVVFTALAFSILLTASVASSASIYTLGGEKCKIMAVSFQELLDRELEKDSTKGAGGLSGYLKDEITSGKWDYYDEDDNFHKVQRVFQVTDSGPYELQVTMYWSQPEGGTIQYGNPNSFKDALLFVSVNCAMRGQSYQADARYRLSVNSSEGEGGEATWKWDKDWQK